MSWTQPICDPCWADQRPDQPNPSRIRGDVPQRCCYCGQETTSGIFTRADPKVVPYPSVDHD